MLIIQIDRLWHSTVTGIANLSLTQVHGLYDSVRRRIHFSIFKFYLYSKNGRDFANSILWHRIVCLRVPVRTADSL